MPIDPTIEAASLVAAPQEISPVEQQNRYGSRHTVIPKLEPGKFITVIVTETPEQFTQEEFQAIYAHLQEFFRVTAMQTAFACTVPDFGEQYDNDLHLSAHLRAEYRGHDGPSS